MVTLTMHVAMVIVTMVLNSSCSHSKIRALSSHHCSFHFGQQFIAVYLTDHCPWWVDLFDTLRRRPGAFDGVYEGQQVGVYSKRAGRLVAGVLQTPLL